MIRINLLPFKAVQKKERLYVQLLVMAAALVLVFLACGGVYASLMLKIHGEKVALKEKQDEIESLKKTIGEVGKFQKLQKELQGKLDVLDKLKAGKTGPVHLLDDLSAAVPEKLWISSFKEAKGAITVTGFGASEEIVAQYMQNLEKSPYYKNVELQVVEQVPQAGGKVHRFTLGCQAETATQTPSPKVK